MKLCARRKTAESRMWSLASAIASFVPGTTAMLTPLTKKTKTSLKLVFEKSLYSSDENTYWNCTVEKVGTKSNSRTVASKVSSKRDCRLP